MQSATKISLVTLVVAVAALVFALWPVVADAPWELKRTAEGRRLQEKCDEAKQRWSASHPHFELSDAVKEVFCPR